MNPFTENDLSPFTENEQFNLIMDVCRRKRVIEYGSGNLMLASLIAEFGQGEILAIDKIDCPFTYLRRNLTYRKAYFQYLTVNDVSSYDVAVLAKPNVYNTANLERLVAQAEQVVYLGYNFDGTITGSEALWEHLRHREVLAYVPQRARVLIVYGAIGERREDDDLYPEELGGVDRETMFQYTDSTETLNQVFGK